MKGKKLSRKAQKEFLDCVVKNDEKKLKEKAKIPEKLKEKAIKKLKVIKKPKVNSQYPFARLTAIMGILRLLTVHEQHLLEVFFKKDALHMSRVAEANYVNVAVDCDYV